MDNHAVWNQGRDACKKGECFGENPYKGVNSELAILWGKGWKSAKRCPEFIADKTKKEKLVAYNKGINAFDAHIKRDNNPYLGGNLALFAAWKKGWNDRNKQNSIYNKRK